MLIRPLVLILLVLLTLAFFPPLSEARSESHVKGYVKKGGKPVPPHKRKSPNKNKLDNYGTKGNLNPNTGSVGKEDPFAGKEKR